MNALAFVSSRLLLTAAFNRIRAKGESGERDAKNMQPLLLKSKSLEASDIL